MRFVRRRTRVTREVEATRSQMTGYRVSAARRNSLLLGTARSLALGPQSVQGRKGRRVKGVGKKGREARGVFRASCRGVQQVIVFGIHLHASSAFARFLSSSIAARLPPLSPSHRSFSLVSCSLARPFSRPSLRRALYVILSTAFLSTGRRHRRTRYPSFIRLRFLAKIRAKGVSRGIPSRRPTSIKSCRHFPPRGSSISMNRPRRAKLRPTFGRMINSLCARARTFSFSLYLFSKYYIFYIFRCLFNIL